jgi:formylglycine-generating enzyme required for sulfatase activity
VCAALAEPLAGRPLSGEAEADPATTARRRGHAAAALVVLGDPEAAWPVLKHAPTPDARTVLIRSLGPRGAPAHILIRRLETEPDASARAALILALGEYTETQLAPPERAALTPMLLEWYRTDPDPGVHGAIDWLLRQDRAGLEDRPLNWEGRASLERMDTDLAGKTGPVGRGWFVNGQGQTFSTVSGPVVFLMGSPPDEQGRYPDEGQHRRRIGRSFALGTKSVTFRQFEAFLRAHPGIRYPHGGESAPDPDCPARVTWYEAAQYCRWLSEKEGAREDQQCFPSIAEIEKCKDGVTPLKLPADYLTRTGYRLPTEAEWEYACRAGTQTRYSFGSEEDMLADHAWYIANARDRAWPPGQKKPNAFGLFDMHGNVWNWCRESYWKYEPGTDSHPAEDAEDTRSVGDPLTIVLRSGSFDGNARWQRSANRGYNRPTYRADTTGFRLARTLPPNP